MGENTWKIGETVEIPEEAIKIALENEMSFSDRFYLLAKRSPFFLAGIVGLTTVCGIGAYKWKTRTVKPSIFIVQLRVAAQATTLGIISLGMFYGMYNDYIKKKEKKE